MNSLTVYPTTACEPSAASILAMASFTASIDLSTMATPPTSLLWRMSGDTTLTTAFAPGSRARSMSLAAPPRPTNT
jgi:hypothetical protein